jgi:hypothetical protein
VRCASTCPSVRSTPPGGKKEKGGGGRGRRQALGVVGGLLDPHLALLQGDTQSRRLPPVRCASAGAERREGELCADPAVRATPQAKKREKNWRSVMLVRWQ